MEVNSLTINANKYVDITSVAANVVLVKRVPSTVISVSSENQKEILTDQTLHQIFLKSV